MQLTLGYSPYQEQTQTQLCLQIRYQTIGDLELFSLHRIKNRIGGLDINPITRNHIIRGLMKENEDYRHATSSGRFCVTLAGFENSFDNTINYLRDQARLGVNTLDNPEYRQAFSSIMSSLIGQQDTKMRQWFGNNYNALIYDTGSKIPFPVVRQMRRRFSSWVLGQSGISLEPIESLIEDAAKEEGLNSDDYESYREIWEEMKRG